MPKVKTKSGKVKHFPYTPAGMHAAMEEKMKMKKRGKKKGKR